MSGWAPRRFWTAATVVPGAAGVAVRLDDRPVRTPAKAPLELPTLALAEAVAAEWDAQGELVEPATMPLTRMANSTLDTVTRHTEAVADQIAAYGESDLICYRAEAPAELVRRQAEAWDPLVDWARRAHGAPLVLGSGVMFVAQPAASVAALRVGVAQCDPFALTALHELVTLSGSLVIGLAALARAWPRPELWARSRVDEIWQEEQWGEDAEASATAARKAAAFADAARFHDLSRIARAADA